MPLSFSFGSRPSANFACVVCKRCFDEAQKIKKYVFVLKLWRTVFNKPETNGVALPAAEVQVMDFETIEWPKKCTAQILS